MRGGSNVSDAQLQQILENIPRIINDPRAAELLVTQANELGERLAKEVGMAQIRDIFDELSLIADLFTWKHEPVLALRRLYLLRPKVLWRAARNKKLMPLARVLEKAVDEVVKAETDEERHERFRRLMEFMEAIVAYHKFYGGGD